GGHLLINVPALQGLFSAYDIAAGHVRRYDRRSLAAEFAGHDFRVLDVRYWGLSLVPLLFLRKLVLRGSRPAEETIRSGFRPPGRLTNAVLQSLMHVETALVARSPVCCPSSLTCRSCSGCSRRRSSPAGCSTSGTSPTTTIRTTSSWSGPSRRESGRCGTRLATPAFPS